MQDKSEVCELLTTVGVTAKELRQACERLGRKLRKVRRYSWARVLARGLRVQTASAKLAGYWVAEVREALEHEATFEAALKGGGGE